MFPDSSQRINVCVTGVGLKALMLLIEHRLRSSQLDGERAHPSDSVFFASKPAVCHADGHGDRAVDNNVATGCKMIENCRKWSLINHNYSGASCW